jgi:hypothetical protein
LHPLGNQWIHSSASPIRVEIPPLALTNGFNVNQPRTSSYGSSCQRANIVREVCTQPVHNLKLTYDHNASKCYDMGCTSPTFSISSWEAMSSFAFMTTPFRVTRQNPHYGQDLVRDQGSSIMTSCLAEPDQPCVQPSHRAIYAV